MNSATARLVAAAKPILKPLAQATLGRLPPPRSRLNGELARNGGTPVRDVRLRPWATATGDTLAGWTFDMRAKLRRIYLSGVEGLPQPLAEEFAGEWAAYCGCRHALLLTHGTDALRIGLAAALDHDGLEYGGEVVVPNFSFIASATAALDRRVGVALVDVDPETLLIDPEKVEEAIIPGRTRAIIPVHLFGQPADMTALRAIAKKHDLKIVEDAAQAHGAVWENGPVGSLGDVGAFSFQSSKNLNSGEGGALTTNDDELFERAYSLHNAGRARIDGGRWEHVSLGWNCRITEYQAALLLHRLKSFDRLQQLRRANFDRLRALMSDARCLVPLSVQAGLRAHGMYMFAMRYQPAECGGLGLADFLDLVQAEGAPIYRAFASTMAEQPALAGLMNRRPEYIRRLPTPVADQAATDTVFIPQGVFLGSSADMNDIVAAICKVEQHCNGKASTSRAQRGR